MKNFTKFLALAIVGFAFSAATFAQATATASATIISPIAISKTADLSFGNIAPGASGGNATVSNAGVRSLSGTLTGPSTGITAAGFTVTGLSGASFTITLPASVTLTSGANSMTLDTWDNALGAGPNYTLTGGSISFGLGGVLHVAAAQVAGSYSGSFNVTVGYN